MARPHKITAPTEPPARISLYLAEDQVQKITDLRRAEDDMPGQNEIIRRLIDRAHDALPRRKR